MLRLSAALAPIKRFLSWRWTQRTLLLLCGICVGITGMYFTGGLYAQHQKEKETEALSVPKDFGTISLLPFFNANIFLLTAWSQGTMKYRLSIFYPTPYLVKQQSRNEGQIDIVFFDAHGFIVSTVNVPMGQFRQILDPSGKTVELQANTSVGLSKESYGQVVSWLPASNITSEATARQADQERLKELSGLRKEMGTEAGRKMVDEQVRQLKKEIDELYGRDPLEVATEWLDGLPTVEVPKPKKSRSFEEMMAELDTMKPVSSDQNAAP